MNSCRGSWYVWFFHTGPWLQVCNPKLHSVGVCAISASAHITRVAPMLMWPMLKDRVMLSNLCCLTQILSIHSVNTLHANVVESLQHCQKRWKLRGLLALLLPTPPFQLQMSGFFSQWHRPEMIHLFSRKISVPCMKLALMVSIKTKEGKNKIKS